MKKIVFLFIALTTMQLSQAARKLKTNNDSVSYALGYKIGCQQLNNPVLKNCDQQMLLQAIADALNKDASTMNLSTANGIMIRADKAVKAQEQKKKEIAYKESSFDNKQYLASKKIDVKYKELPNSWDSTATGVLRKVLKQGNGEVPTVSSVVKFNYSYKLRDGKLVSKSSQPIEGLVSNLLPGLQDAFTNMPVGSKWEVVIPSELGFDKDTQYYEDGRIMVPANSILIFEIELINTGTPEAIDYYGGE